MEKMIYSTWEIIITYILLYFLGAKLNVVVVLLFGHMTESKVIHLCHVKMNNECEKNQMLANGTYDLRIIIKRFQVVSECSVFCLAMNYYSDQNCTWCNMMALNLPKAYVGVGSFAK